MASIVSTVFPAVAPSAAGARRFVMSALRREGVEPDQVSLAALLTSELVTNAYLHAGTETKVSVWVGDVIHVDVFDSGGGGVALITADIDDLHGRGLHIVDALADRWDFDDGPDGARVWFELIRERAGNAGVA